MAALLNITDLLSTLTKGNELCEPKVEQLMGKLKRLQQDKRVIEEEIQKIQAVSESLQKELEILQTESYQLERIYKEKEELCQKLQYQCEEQDISRHIQLNKSGEELSEQYTCEIQVIKLRHRKLRIKFENQLHQLLEQQKNLYSVFMPERLPAEIESTENTKGQLLSAENLKMAQLSSLDEDIEKVKQQKQETLVAAVVQEE